MIRRENYSVLRQFISSAYVHCAGNESKHAVSRYNLSYNRSESTHVFNFLLDAISQTTSNLKSTLGLSRPHIKKECQLMMTNPGEPFRVPFYMSDIVSY